MESSSEVKRSTHVISVQPNETVLTALPYGPHSSLLEFLKGEPKVLGACQVLLALIIAGIGAIFALNHFNFAQRFPLVFLTGYPFWGAFIFTVTGYLTGTNSNDKCVGQGVTGLNVISSVVAVAGIIFTIISYRYQHKYCQGPSLEGICVIGRVLYNGILSVLLIISIAELSIAVTIASFRSNCWANSNEMVFFLPSDVTQESELSVPDENAVIQFELQEESTSADSTTNIKPVFFGGYSFFKLRVTKNQFTFRHAGRRGSNSFNTSSLFMEDERQKYVPQTLSLYGEEVEVKHSPPIVEQKSSEIMMNTEPLKDEDLQAAITQSPEEKPPLLQDQASKLQLFPSYSVKSVHNLPPQDLPYQAPRAKTLPEQDLLSEASTSVTESHGITSQDKESQGIPLQNTQSHDMLSDYLPSPDMPAQDLPFQRQALPLQAIPFGAISLLSVQSSNMQHLDRRSLDFQLHNTQSQEQRAVHLSYQNIKSEVMLMTEEWKPEEELQSRRPSKQHSQLQQSKGCPCAKQKAFDMYIQDQPHPRRKSLDKHIKSWLSPKKQYIDKEIQVSQTILQLPDQQAENLRIQEEKPPRQLYQDMQIQEYHDWQSPDRKVQTWQSLGQKSQERRTQDWKSKEWEKQEWQLEMQHSQNWDFQTWQTQDLQVKESRKQRSLFQETQTLHATIPSDLDEQSQDVLQDSQHQNKDQQDLQSARIQKEVIETDAVQTRGIKSEDTSCGKSQTPSDLQSEDAKSDFNCFSYQSSVQELHSTGSQKQDMETDAVQTRGIKSEDTSCGKSQSPTDLQLEDIKPDSNCSSYQSSVQDTYHAYMSNKNSEQDVKQDTSTCSAVCKEGQSLASASCGSKERQQSEDLG
ncbi:membrane-spanning 4-domains subfamily A member 14 [Bubalus bubalis]|uniref:membrane-spanning 4-domains subfamily A member 14 n=1 Tax=Bubalus bubalis TaxID=89462 RepID=UPI001E1B7D25|nr:membrane-spanning 4-domains subfamily A member 14 [Bubalus bubalis]